MKTRRFIRCAVCVSILFAVPAQAQEGWKLPNLNPFSKADEPKPKPRKPTKREADSKSGWSLPSLNPWSSSTTKTSTARKPVNNGPSTWDKMSTGTKNMWTKTKDTLNPWKQDEPPPRRPATGLNLNSATARQPEKKPGMFTSWMKGDKEPVESPRTVNEWLAQPMPH